MSANLARWRYEQRLWQFGGGSTPPPRCGNVRVFGVTFRDSTARLVITRWCSKHTHTHLGIKMFTSEGKRHLVSRRLCQIYSTTIPRWYYFLHRGFTANILEWKSLLVIIPASGIHGWFTSVGFPVGNNSLTLHADTTLRKLVPPVIGNIILCVLRTRKVTLAHPAITMYNTPAYSSCL